MPFLFKKPDDGSVDAPYEGLDREIERETLSQREQQRLRFVRWGLKHNRGGFHEFLLTPDRILDRIPDPEEPSSHD